MDFSPADDQWLTAALQSWLPTQRWCDAGDDDPVDIRSRTPVWTAAEVHVELVLVTAPTPPAAAAADRGAFAIPLAWRSGIPDIAATAALGAHDGVSCYDALHDHDFTTALGEAISRGTDIGPIRVRPMANAGVELTEPGLPMGVEQTNTSLVYGDAAVLKVFRRIHDGIHPEAEVLRGLADQGSAHIAPPLAELTTPSGATLAIASRFYTNSADGWIMALGSLRDLLAEADLHADEVGGDFAGEAQRLGETIAGLHHDLAAAFGTRELGADDLAALADARVARMETVIRTIPALRERHTDLVDTFRRWFTTADARARAHQRIHGDLHLGQALRTIAGWIVIDFEGEPGEPLADRRAHRSPLEDLAGMVRSFDYAARQGVHPWHDDAQQTFRRREWARRNQQAFLRGYADRSGTAIDLQLPLLRAFVLDKAVYEVGYDHRHRPGWERAPLEAVADMLADAG